MIFPEGIKVYGDKSFRGKCAPEDAELITFFNQLRSRYPDIFKIALHIKNEGKRTHQQVNTERAKGALKSGASDIVIPTGFICELKRRDHTKSRIEDGQPEFMTAAQQHGAFVCIALGWESAFEALEDWLKNKPR